VRGRDIPPRRKKDPPMTGPKALKARKIRARLERRDLARERDQVNAVTAPLHMTDNQKGWSLVRAWRYRKRRMAGYKAVGAYRRFGQILKGQSFFGRTKAERVRVSQRGRSRS